MQREEKQLDSALEAILIRINDLKTTIATMILKIENEYQNLNWPNFLDNFALVSGHLTSLFKILNHDKAPSLRNLTVLPLHLCPEKDEDLYRRTEGRISTFAHDLVPDYLRTKPDPSVEQKILSYEAKVANLTYDITHKQVAQYNKVINHIWDIANKAREEWESDTISRTTQTQTSSGTDTQILVCAVGSGKGLKSESMQMVQSGVNPIANNIMVGRSGQTQASGQGSIVGPVVKTPSAIKTNIKAASQIHPYGR
ncbi:mediator of RNA polymerase II transcription subunit 8 isoform X1 [Phymastichus coffea]|uniref:mediator of RNA polymerase II transcription subunit 8 isoform X1 n=1 Tax=Phymastichus coffea TaxID=108790 RepID=UPI00273CC845|nr:mediator of RNA polymerase II transcription subunit 8 isoform X1 [Phymastichus coffea]